MVQFSRSALHTRLESLQGAGQVGKGLEIIFPWLNRTVCDVRTADVVEDEARVWAGLEQFHDIGKITPDSQFAMQSIFAQELHAANEAGLMQKSDPLRIQ